MELKPLMLYRVMMLGKVDYLVVDDFQQLTDWLIVQYGKEAKIDHVEMLAGAPLDRGIHILACGIDMSNLPQGIRG